MTVREASLSGQYQLRHAEGEGNILIFHKNLRTDQYCDERTADLVVYNLGLSPCGTRSLLGRNKDS